MGKYLDSTGLQHFMSLIKTALGLKQDALVSGTNIKTVNNQSLLGSGNITISGGGTDIDQYISDFGPLTYTEDQEWWTDTLAVDYGGTGATNAADARTNLGLGTAATHAHGDYALASHTHSYLPLSGGTVDGDVNVTGHVTSNELTYTSGGGESQLSNPNHDYRICVTSAGNLRRDSSSDGGTSWTSAGYYANSGIAASVNSTISEIVTQTTAQAGNYTITAASYAQWGRMVQVVITIQPTAAVSAGASMSIGTIVAGKRPTLLAVAGSTYMHGGITAAGAISMRCRTAMTAGTSYNIAATYILA